MNDNTLMLFGRDGGDGVFEKSDDYGQTWNYWRTLQRALAAAMSLSPLTQTTKPTLPPAIAR
jgi:hypothetical protein